MQTRSILGVNVHDVTLDQLERLCVSWLGDQIPHRIVTVNPEYVMMAQRDAHFKDVINSADVIVADGAGIVWAAKKLYGATIQRITGADFAWDLARICAHEGKSIYLLGAQSDEVAQKAATAFQRRYPELRIVGMKGGISPAGSLRPYFPEFTKDSEMAALLADIKQAAPDVIMVAYGAPKQDLWIYEYLSQLPSIKIAIGVGGALDYAAGVVPRASRLMRQLGLEWLFRLLNQPIQRWRRIITATVEFPRAVKVAKKEMK